MVDNVSAEERRKELFEESQKYTYPEDAPGIKLRYKDTAFVLFKQSQDDPKSFLSFGTRRSSSVSQYGNTPVIVRRSRSSNGELSTVVEQWAPLHNRTSISNYTLTEAPTTEDSDSDEEVDVTVRNVRELQDVKEVLSEESTPEGIEDALNDHGKPPNDEGEEGKNVVAGTTEHESRKSFMHYEIPLHRHKINDSNSETVHDATNLNIKESNSTPLLDNQEDCAYKESVLFKIVTERQINEAYNLQDTAVDNLNNDDAQDDSLPYIDAQDGLSAERMGESYKYDSIEDIYPKESPDRGNRSSIIPPPPPTKEEEEERAKDRDSLDGSIFPLLKIVEPCDLEPAASNTGQPLPVPPSVTQPAASNTGHPLPVPPSETQPAASNTGQPLPVPPSVTQPAASNTGQPLPPSETLSSHYILDDDDDDDADFANAIIPISPKIDIRSERSSYDAPKQNNKQIPSPIKIPKSISSIAESENNTESSLLYTTTQNVKVLMPSPPKLAESPSKSKGISEMCGPTAGNGDLVKGGSCDEVNKSFDVEDRTSFLDLPIRSPTPPKKSPRRSPRSPKGKDTSHTHRSSLVLPMTTETPASVPKGSRSASPSTKSKEPGRVFTFSLKKKETSKSASSLNSKKGQDKDKFSDLDEDAVGAQVQEGESQLEASGKRVGVRSMIIDGTIKRNFIVIHPSDDSDTIGLAPISSVSNGQGTTHAETPKALSSVKSHIIGLSTRKVESLQKVSLKLDLKEELPDMVGSSGQVSAPQRIKRTKKKAEVHGSSHSLTSQPVMESHKEIWVSRTTSQLSEIDCDSATPSSQSMRLSSPRVTSRLCSIM